ncbi:MAG: RNA-binding cell elongation regulator Jag/EloR [Anaerolineae bacterium]|jgi:spoIIIJ-associated protein|nr:KH domain-containing protein [Chloroflexota bacterium]
MDRETRAGEHKAEFSGKSVEEALEAAAEALEMPVSTLQYEVLRDSTRSFLGFVRTGEVTIRVSWVDEVVLPAAPESDLPEEDVEPVHGEQERPSAPSHPAGLDDDGAELAAAGRDGNPRELEQVAQEVLTTLLDKMGALAAVEVVSHGGVLDPEANEVSPLVLNIVGDDLGVLIGRRGETLRSLQFMTRLIVSRRLGVWPNLVLDVEGYKARREETLRALALRVASQVRSSGQPMSLEPMPANERRIVHLALRDDPDVYTESTGKDDRRKVQIIPR